MYFIDEQDYLAVAVHHFLDYAFEAFLKLSLILRSCYECTKVKGIYLSALEVLRHVSVDYLLGDSFRNGCLTDSRFSYKNGIVLGPSAEYLQNPSYLFVPSDHRIELSLCCPLIEIDSKSAEIFKLVFCHISVRLYDSQFIRKFPQLRSGSQKATLAVCSFEQTAKSQIIFQSLFF